MAYISIPADSDGDLHDANMHNNKFNTIADKINGNIDHDNLAFPQSIYTWNFSAGKHYDHGGTSNRESSGYTNCTPTTGALFAFNQDPTAGSAAAGGTNVIRDSWVGLPVSTAVDIVDIYIMGAFSSIYTAGQNFTIIGQRTASVTPFLAAATYDTVFTATSDFRAASSAPDPSRFGKLTIATNPITTLGVGNTFRIVMTNPDPFAAGELPNLCVQMTVKSRHAA